MGKEEIPNSKSVVQFRDGSFGVAVRPAAGRPMDGVDGVVAGGIGGTATAYIVSLAESHVRQRQLRLPDGRNESAVAVARDPASGHTVFAIERAKLETLRIPPCDLALGFPALGSVVTIYGGLGNDLAIKSQVIKITPEGGIQLDLLQDSIFEGSPAFTDEGRLIGFMKEGFFPGPTDIYPARDFIKFNPVARSKVPFFTITPVAPGFVMKSKKKLENYLRDTQLTLDDLRGDPGAYMEMRRACRYIPTELGFRLVHSHANGGFLVVALPNNVDKQGVLMFDRTYGPGNLPIETYPDSDPKLRTDFTKANVMAITQIIYTNFNGITIDSKFGDRFFDYALAELEKYADFDKPISLTAVLEFAGGLASVTRTYTLFARTLSEIDRYGKSQTRQNHEQSDLVMRIHPRLPAINGIRVPDGLRIEDTAAFLPEALELDTRWYNLRNPDFNFFGGGQAYPGPTVLDYK